MNGEVINDAVYNRNAAVEDRLGIESLHVDPGFLFTSGTGNFHQNMRTAWVGKNNSNVSSALTAIERVMGKQMDKLNTAIEKIQ